MVSSPVMWVKDSLSPAFIPVAVLNSNRRRKKGCQVDGLMPVLRKRNGISSFYESKLVEVYCEVSGVIKVAMDRSAKTPF